MELAQPRTAHVILNPTSGGGEGRRVRAEIERELERRGVRCVLTQTEAPCHATELARRAAGDGAALIVAAGGDGTIHEVANGILGAGSATALGLIPIGRGNDFVKVVPGTTPRRVAYDTVAVGSALPVDAGLAEWDGGSEYFLNAIGTGIDVEVVRQIARAGNLPTSLVYIVGLAKAFFRFEPIRLRVTIDGRQLDRRVMIVAVANGQCVGGSFLLCPHARPDDGELDACIVNEVNLAGVLRIIPRIMRGTHVGMPAVLTSRAHAVTIESVADAPLVFQVDGELREPPRARTLRVAVVPGALRVVAAAGAGGVGGQQARARSETARTEGP